MLLYLIRKHNLDILDVPVLSIYPTIPQAYIGSYGQGWVELAADYLVMAAYPWRLNPVSLLPARR